MSDNPSSAAVLEALRAKRAGQTPCPACGGRKYDFVGVADVAVRPSTDSGRGSHVIPLAVIGCPSCGYVVLHAVGPLVQPSKEPPTPKAETLELSKEEAETVLTVLKHTPVTDATSDDLLKKVAAFLNG